MKNRNKQRTHSHRSQDVTITGMAAQGWGVAGKGRDRVHVWGGLFGDRLQVRRVRRERGRVEAAIEAVEHREMDLVPAQCVHFDVCGGCLWQHVPYAAQLQMKHEIVKACFAQQRLDTAGILPVLGCDDPFFYRNKNDFTFGFGEQGPALGFFESAMKISGGRRRSQRGHVPDVFEVQSCALQSGVADRILGHIRLALETLKLPYFHPGSRRGVLRSLVIRQSAHSGDVLVNFVAAKDCGDMLQPVVDGLMAAEPQVKGVVLSVNNKRSKNAAPQTQTLLAGQGWIEEQILDLRVRVSPGAFLQVNTHQAEKLYGLALALADVTAESKVIDLYCGTGSLSLLLAQRCHSVLGIEVVDSAVADAQENARQNDVDNCAFVCGDVADMLPDKALHIHPDVITVNPPRAGVYRTVIDEICRVGPKRVVYISCNAETLARDLVHFNRGGYRIGHVQPVDMFPQTPHVEVVVLLELRP